MAVRRQHERSRYTKPPQRRRDVLPQSPSAEQRSARWPEMRIDRPVNYEAAEAERWVRFLNSLGERNYGKGNVKSLGSMACTFFSAQDMGRMLEDKYPKAFQERKTTVRILRKTSDALQRFMAEHQQTVVEVNAAKVEVSAAAFDEWDRGGLEAFDLEEDIDYYLPQPDRELWRDRTFMVGSEMGLFDGQTTLGVDLNMEDDLHEEYEGLRKHLSHNEGLNLALCGQSHDEHEFRAHVSVMEGFGPLYLPDIQYAQELPMSMPLRPPTGRVNTN